ncbi:hypothetical protein EDD86DRAFT_199168 [Gorgonomyces haynaldii]|nr:hypothetical protein EDD86DRAFT_199168 [Gorgonomyces haynaldii]
MFSSKPPPLSDKKASFQVDGNQKTKFEGDEDKEPVLHTSLSLSSTTSSAGGKDGRKELNESLYTRLMFLKYNFIALACNLLLLAFFLALSSDAGFKLTNMTSSMLSGTSIIFLALLYAVHAINFHALRNGSAAYFGYLLCRKGGYSIIVSQFLQDSLLSKVTFASKLSFRSPSRKLLTRVAMLNLFHALVSILPIALAVYIVSNPVRIDMRTLSCLIYTQDGPLIDRGFPTLEVEMGCAEYVFGTSLGFLSSEMPIPYSTHILPPQIIDVLDDGSTIIGGGFLTDVQSTCTCAPTLVSDDLVDTGIDASLVAQMQTLYRRLGNELGVVNALSYNTSGENAVVMTMISGIDTCYTTNLTWPSVPVCKTIIGNHRKGTIVAKFMTDGTPASIALKSVDVRSEDGPADNTWLMAALTNILEGSVNSHVLPKVYPGAINPMLWWTTANMQGVNAAFLSAGLETFWTMVLRAGMQRTFTPHNQFCTQNQVDPNSVVLTFDDSTASLLGNIFVAGQILVSVVSLLMSLPYLIVSFPMGVGIRFCLDSSFFRLMLQQPLQEGIIKDYYQPNAESAFILPTLDVVLRLGESMKTRDDPDIGNICLGKPKLISNFINGKLYL